MKTAVCAIAAICTALAQGFSTEGDHQWAAAAADAGGSRHSAARLMTPANVSRLEVAWVYRTGDYRVGARGGRFEATPLLVDGWLYVSTPFGRVIALDPVTGDERWHYDPGVDLSVRYGDWANRGVATWVDTTRAEGERCRRRIFVAPIDARLIALDAATGEVCADFGREGVINLKDGVRNAGRTPGEYQITSPPAILGELVIVGSAVADNQRVDAPRGLVRAFHARSGTPVWSWDPVPADPARRVPGSWHGADADVTGAANAWAPMAVDDARRLVFIPVGSASPDYYGGTRLGRNDYANSVVALRGDTGEVAWHFQAVHHDLWDYDVPAQPVLVDLRRNGARIPAVVQATKMGHTFVLHRDSGEPLFDVEERPVPASSVPGEQAWPTQPFPVAPPPLVPQRLRPEDAWGLTPEDRDDCRRRLAALEWQGMFTPPGLQGTLVYPGNIGGSNWSGLSWDAARGLLFAPANRLAAAVRLVPRDALQRGGSGRAGVETAPQRGTPYAVQREFLLSPGGIPCNPPPWGTLTAIDIAAGTTRWEVPLGRLAQLQGRPEADAWGSANLGGVMSTAGGLVFASGGFDERLHAFDSATGRRLWSANLPAGGNAAPMTYVIDGRQFVVIAAGGHDRLGTTPGDYVVAFALPRAASGEAKPQEPLSGSYAGHLLVGGGRYPVQLQVREIDTTTADGRLSGPLTGAVTGRIAGQQIAVEVPFTLASEQCAGVLRGDLARANRGRMLVGEVRLSGGCSDGREERGVLAARKQ